MYIYIRVHVHDTKFVGARNLKQRHYSAGKHLHAATAIVTDDVILCLVGAVARWQCSAAAVRVAVVVTLTLSVATRQNDAVTVTVTVNHGARGICALQRRFLQI